VKHIPKQLVAEFIEVCLDQTNPTREFQTLLNTLLVAQASPFKLIGTGFIILEEV